MAYSQADPSWGDTPLGTCRVSIASSGCVITSLANMVGKTPAEINQILLSGGGFANGCETIWERAAELLGLTYTGSASTISVFPCIGMTSYYAPHGYPTHFFLILDANTMIDPLDGKEHPISKYPLNLVINITKKPMDQEQLDRLNYLEGLLKGVEKSAVFLTPDGKGHTVITYQGEDQVNTVYGVPVPTPVPYVNVASVDIEALNKLEPAATSNLNLQPELDTANAKIAALTAAAGNPSTSDAKLEQIKTIVNS